LFELDKLSIGLILLMYYYKNLLIIVNLITNFPITLLNLI